MSKIQVYEHHQFPDNERYRSVIRKREAHRLVENGLANWVTVRWEIPAIQLIKPVIEPHVNCRSARIYEKAGAEPFPKFVQGGLTRTEHKPSKFQPFKGAKVGHQ